MANPPVAAIWFDVVPCGTRSPSSVLVVPASSRPPSPDGGKSIGSKSGVPRGQLLLSMFARRPVSVHCQGSHRSASHSCAWPSPAGGDVRSSLAAVKDRFIPPAVVACYHGDRDASGCCAADLACAGVLLERVWFVPPVSDAKRSDGFAEGSAACHRWHRAWRPSPSSHFEDAELGQHRHACAPECLFGALACIERHRGVWTLRRLAPSLSGYALSTTPCRRCRGRALSARVPRSTPLRPRVCRRIIPRCSRSRRCSSPIRLRRHLPLCASGLSSTTSSEGSRSTAPGSYRAPLSDERVGGPRV